MFDRVSALPLKLRAGFVLLLAITTTLAITFSAQAQSQTQPSVGAEQFSYEVVSIKLHASGANEGVWWRTTPDGFSTSGTTVLGLIMSAYGLTMTSQIAELPGWGSSETFDVQAKMDEDTIDALKKLSREERGKQQNRMIQGLLADRFGLKVHHELRELPTYDLVIAKSGLKMKAAPPDMHAGWGISNSRIEGKAVSIDSFTISLSSAVGRMVTNKTGLTGNYGITLKWTPDGQQETDDSGPSIFAALEEQLGLKLVPAKGAVDTIVVDHVEKPSPN